MQHSFSFSTRFHNSKKDLFVGTNLSEMLYLHYRHDEAFVRLFLNQIMVKIAAIPVLERLKALRGGLDFATPYHFFSSIAYSHTFFLAYLLYYLSYVSM